MEIGSYDWLNNLEFNNNPGPNELEGTRTPWI